MTAVGYEGCFFPKPDSPALYTKESNGPDGCALFFKTPKFGKVEVNRFVLKDVDTELYTNQVCILAHLKMKCEGKEKEIFVATTHLKAKEGWEQARLQQGAWLLKHLANIVGSKPLVVCGDFNAVPEEEVYQRFCTSELNLHSAYRLLDKDEKEPTYTTWKIRDKEVCRTIDYIWFSKDTMQPCALLDFPSVDQIGENRLPSMNYPSDHLSLVADFVL